VITQVRISPKAQKALRRTPKHVVDKLLAWATAVRSRGLEEIRKLPGFHDEPLRGTRQGQRSIRLNRAYRAIYIIATDGSIEFVSVEEVHKHDY
jgi:toxin HigB-1